MLKLQVRVCSLLNIAAYALVLYVWFTQTAGVRGAAILYGVVTTGLGVCAYYYLHLTIANPVMTTIPESAPNLYGYTVFCICLVMLLFSGAVMTGCLYYLCMGDLVGYGMLFVLSASLLTTCQTLVIWGQ